MKVKVKVKRIKGDLDSDISLPEYKSQHAAGMDLAASVEQDLFLEPGQRVAVPTGIVIELPEGYEAQIRPRSGLALNDGITLLNSPGTIDSDYRGEIKVILINLGKRTFVVKRGMRVAQMIISPVCHAQLDLVEEVLETQRNAGGFGSTG